MSASDLTDCLQFEQRLMLVLDVSRTSKVVNGGTLIICNEGWRREVVVQVERKG